MTTEEYPAEWLQSFVERRQEAARLRRESLPAEVLALLPVTPQNVMTEEQFIQCLRERNPPIMTTEEYPTEWLQSFVERRQESEEQFEQLERRRQEAEQSRRESLPAEVFAPLPATPLNSQLNRELSALRRDLPISKQEIISYLSEQPLNRLSRIRRERLAILITRNAQRASPSNRLAVQLCTALSKIPPSVDETAVARAFSNDDFTFNREENGDICLEWTTEAITLSDDDGENTQNLGRFRVQAYIGACRCKAFALEPNPSAQSPDTTHPHVRHNTICLGGYGVDIKRFSQAGQFNILRQTVDSLLNTYNSESPYCSLENWVSVVCEACNRVCQEQSLCPECDGEMCEHCSVWCDGYNMAACCSCVVRCASCRNYFAESERGSCGCSECDLDHCSNCNPS